VEVAKYANPQAAITAAQALGVPVVVKFGTGTYTLASALNVTASDVTLDLGRAILVPTFAGTAITFNGVTGTHLARVGLTGGKIDLNNVGWGGVLFNFCDGPLADRVTVLNGASMTTGAVALLDSPDALVRGVRATNCGSGVTLTRSPRGSVSNCQTTAAKRDGVTVYDASHNTTVTGCTVNGFNTSADNGRAGIQSYGSDGVVITGNTIDAGSVGGTEDSAKIRLRDSLSFAVSGNVCTGSPGPGIVVIALSDIGNGAGKGTISGNTIRNVQSYGIEVALGAGGLAASLYSVVITGNTVIGVRQFDVNPGQGVTVVAGADATVIGSNYLEDLDGEGIQCDANAAIVGNIIRNCGKGTLGTKSGIFVTAGISTVVGNYCLDDQVTHTMTYGLNVYTGAVAHATSNVYVGTAWDTVNLQGTENVLLGDYDSAKVGFFGKAPASRPAAPPADATDLATAITLVNDLKTKLRAVGLMA